MSLHLTPKTVPSEAEIPGSLQAIINLFAEYVGIAGNENVIGLNFGSATPASDNRDKPWFKTTPTGSPVGLYSWNGTEWVQTPSTTVTGNTAARPPAPNAGTQYFDTDINCALIFERGKWRTVFGAPGTVQFVSKATLAEAIKQNPGWIQFAAANGRVLGAAGEGSGLTDRDNGEVAGEESVTLTADQLPAHAHATAWKAYSGQHQNGSQAVGIYPVVTGTGTTNTQPIGGDKAHGNMQPTYFLWCLIKE